MGDVVSGVYNHLIGFTKYHGLSIEYEVELVVELSPCPKESLGFYCAIYKYATRRAV